MSRGLPVSGPTGPGSGSVIGRAVSTICLTGFAGAWAGAVGAGTEVGVGAVRRGAEGVVGCAGVPACGAACPRGEPVGRRASVPTPRSAWPPPPLGTRPPFDRVGDGAAAEPAVSPPGAATTAATSLVGVRCGPVCSAAGGAEGPAAICPSEPSPPRPLPAATRAAAPRITAGAKAVVPAAWAARRRHCRTRCTGPC